MKSYHIALPVRSWVLIYKKLTNKLPGKEAVLFVEAVCTFVSLWYVSTIFKISLNSRTTKKHHIFSKSDGVLPSGVTYPNCGDDSSTWRQKAFGGDFFVYMTVCMTVYLTSDISSLLWKVGTESRASCQPCLPVSSVKWMIFGVACKWISREQ